MEYKDYYKILEVDKKASQEEIKKAYRKLANKYHPDKNPGNKEAEDMFKQLNEANSVLGDPEKRKQYDELGANWNQYQQGAPPPGGNPFAGAGRGFDAGYDPFGGSSDFSDFFEQFFGHGGGNGRFRNTGTFKGNDFETEIEISLEEAYHGTHRIIQLESEKIRVTTKPGAYDGQVLRIKGKGGKGSSKELTGDLFVRVKVMAHAPFVRMGHDVTTTHTIDLYTAVLGGETVVATLSGKVKVPIAAGSQNGKTIRLKGKGMPMYEKPETFGDLYIQLQVHIPDKLSEKQKDLFKQLKEITSI